MYLINWLQSNLLMVFTVLVLFGIPLVVAIIVFTKKPKSDTEEKPE